MNKLEETIKRLKILECDCIYFENGKCTYDKNKCQREQDIETALNHIDNSISKEVIEEKIEEVKYRLNETMITEKDMHYSLGKHAVLQELLEKVNT